MSYVYSMESNISGMRVLLDGDSMLGGVSVLSIGSDTVVMFNVVISTLYICAHLKDYKPLEDASGSFTKQMLAISNIVNANKDKCVHLMLDANTQFEIEGNTIKVFSKNGEKERKTFTFDDGVTVSSLVSEFPTSNKMRGPHTAQLNKSLEPVTATIDHVIVFNGPKMVETSAYTVNSSDSLSKIKSSATLTTSPNSIVDHAFVVSTMEDGLSYGTLNIKGGDVEDKAWAEFIPETYYGFFKDPSVIVQLDKVLMDTFKNYTLATVKGKNFLSTPRCGIFDINLPNNVVPHVSISGDNTSVTVINYDGSYTLRLDEVTNEYVKPVVDPKISEWVDILIGDLNSKEKDGERRKFLLEKGYLLLNYWHNVQNDHTVLVDGRSLSSVYDEWYKASTKKVSIGQMIMEAKMLYANLHVISLQEMPKSHTDADAIIEDIRQNLRTIGHTINVFMMDTSSGSTRGAFVLVH